VRPQEAHAIDEGAQTSLRALLQRNTRHEHDEQRADDNEVGNHIDPVGVGQTSPGDDKAARRRADDECELHQHHADRERVGHLFARHQCRDDRLARRELEG
jgi:hypothetical protein